MNSETIYLIAKDWIKKEHENSNVDWVKLMADDLSRRFDYELNKKLAILDVSKRYSEKDMDDAYDKGFIDGNQRDIK